MKIKYEVENGWNHQPDLVVCNVETDVVVVINDGDVVVDVTGCDGLPLESEIDHRIEQYIFEFKKCIH